MTNTEVRGWYLQTLSKIAADGPAFDQLVRAHRQDGRSDDEAFERIIKEAQATNAEINEQMRPKDRDPGDKPK